MTIIKQIKDITEQMETEHSKAVRELITIDKVFANKYGVEKLIKQKDKQMNAAVKILDFETAAVLRDEIKELEKMVSKK